MDRTGGGKKVFFFFLSFLLTGDILVVFLDLENSDGERCLKYKLLQFN